MSDPELPSISLLPILTSKLPKDVPVFIPAVPEGLATPLAHVIAMHSVLEREINTLHEACTLAFPEDKDKHNARLGLSKKSNGVSRKCKSIFHDHLEISAHFDEICSKAKAFEKRRNIVTHGSFVVFFPKTGPAQMTVNALVNKQTRSVAFTEDDVSDLAYQITDLVGCLMAMLPDTNQNLSYARLSSAQTQIVRDRLANHHHRPATQPKHPRLPLASVE